MNYPFRVLIVKRDDKLYTRVVYQVGSPKFDLGDVTIKYESCPELDIYQGCGNLFLRGYSEHLNHHVSTRLAYRVSDDVNKLFESINDELNHELSLQSING